MAIKVIYLTTSIEDNSVGVRKKIETQISIMQQNDFDVILVDPHLKERWRKYVSFLPFVNINYDFKLLKSLAVSAHCIYIRYFMSNYSLIKTIAYIKYINPKIKILIEIPTFPYDNEIKRISPAAIKDRIMRQLLKKYVTSIITFSSDKMIWGIPTIVISNGIDTSKIKPIHIERINKCIINIIAVACINFWHGYDRIIEGLHAYCVKKHQFEFVVHIVGGGDQKIIQYYKSLVSMYKLHNNIIFYGEKYGKELEKIYNFCDLAFDSLGRHRSNIFFNSSLKGKEYLAKGLPIISGVMTELDTDKNFKYYMRVPADDSPIDFDAILGFYHNINRNNTKYNIINEIRKYCEKKFDINIVFNKVIDAIK